MHSDRKKMMSQFEIQDNPEQLAAHKYYKY